MGSERGSAALAVIGALALATAVGVGVYVAIKNQRAATAETEGQVLAAAQHAVAPEPVVPAVTPDPVPEPVPPVAPTPPVDMAEIDAVDPEVGTTPPNTNAPTFGTPGVEGQLDKDGTAVAVRASSAKLQRCFEKRLKDGAKIGGTLRATLVINRRGGVTSATSVGFDDELGTCVTGVLASVRLPRTKDGGTARVVYPIAFHSANGDDEGEVRARPDPSSEPACDEVSCILNDYEGACCAKFRQPSPRPDPEPVDELPDQPSKEQLAMSFKAQHGPVARCAVKAGFSGMLRVKLRVLPTGKASEVSITDGEPALVACIARAFKTFSFPKSLNGIAVSYPFTIQPGEE